MGKRYQTFVAADKKFKREIKQRKSREDGIEFL